MQQDRYDEPSHVFESILWNSESIAVIKLGRDWNIIDANSAFRAVTGAQTLEGMVMADLLSADDAANWAELSGRMRFDPVLLNYVRGEHQIVTLRSRLYPMPDFELLVGEPPMCDEGNLPGRGLIQGGNALNGKICGSLEFSSQKGR